MPKIKCNDITIYYEIHGEGKPILFLNGLSSDIFMKKAFIDAAKTKCQLIIPDIRGAGLTDKPREDYTISTFTEDIYAFIQNLKLNKLPAMGFSMGGFITMELALKHPEVVSKAILVGTKPAWNKPIAITNHAHKIMHSTEFSKEFLKRVFDLIYGKEYKKHMTPDDYVRLKLAHPNPQPEHAYFGQLYACEHFDLFDEVGKIEQDTLIITGTDDQLIQEENSNWLHQHIKNSKLIKYPDVGHMVVDECPEALMDDVMQFI